MRKLLLSILVLGTLTAADARQSTHATGYRRTSKAWSHLGPRPTPAKPAASGLKRASLDGRIERLEYPSKFDLRDYGYVSSVKDQGLYGCCWAFAACGSLESAILRKTGVEYAFSPRNLALFFGGELDKYEDDTGFGLIDMGSDTGPADGYFLRWAGPVLESDDPYPGVDSDGLAAKKEAYEDFFVHRVAKIRSGEYLPYYDATVSLEFLHGLDTDDWDVIDREAELAGYGRNFRTNFVHKSKIAVEDGGYSTIYILNREILPPELFADCKDRQGPWNIPYHVQGNWRLPPRSSALDNETYKYALMNAGAISVAYCQEDEFRNVTTLKGEEVVAYYCHDTKTEQYTPNHQVLMVGWDDDFPKETFADVPEGDGAFLMKNNWGEDDDAGGYFWISYYDTSLARYDGDTASVYTRVDDVTAPDVYERNYGYDTLGIAYSVGVGKTSATAATLFTAKCAENIRAIGTYLVQWNTQYTVSIYSGCTAGKPTSGVLLYKQSGTREFPGFETIELDQEVAIPAGDLFSVVITYTTPDFKRPVPVMIDDTDKQIYVRKGRSYLKQTDGTWKDLAPWNSKKAFSFSNSPKAHCCKVYTSTRATTGFDGDAKNVFKHELADGSMLTVTVGAASGGKSTVSAKLVKGSKTTTYTSRAVSTKDGLIALKGSDGSVLWLTLAGNETDGNTVTATLGAQELSDFTSLNPNVRGYETVDFRVGVKAVGAPVVENETGKTLTWSASNLPAGVTINAKTGELAGAPTAAVSTEKTARIIATATGGGADSYSFRYKVASLHSWAKGTKTGGGETSAFTFTVGSTGKVSGKLFLGNTNWTFSASCLTAYEAADTNYYFSCKATAGTARLPIQVVLSSCVLTNCTDDIPTTTLGIAEGVADSGDAFVAWANVWSKAPYSDYAKVLAKAPAMKFKYGQLDALNASETLQVKFTTSGRAIAVGGFKCKKDGKSTTYKPTVTIPMLPQDTLEDGAFRALIYPWFAKNTTYKFAGFFSEISLLWDDFRFIAQ